MVLMLLGGGMLVVAVVMFIIAATSLTRALPLGVITGDGGLGEDAIAGADAPGTMTVDLDEGETYTLFLAGPRGVADSGAGLESYPQVTAPSGDERAMGPSMVSAEVWINQTEAYAIASYRAQEDGEHIFDVPAGTGGSSELYVALAEGGDVGGFFGDVFGVVGYSLGGFLFGLTGLVLLIVGLVIGVSRRRRRREYYAAYPWASEANG